MSALSKRVFWFTAATTVEQGGRIGCGAPYRRQLQSLSCSFTRRRLSSIPSTPALSAATEPVQGEEGGAAIVKEVEQVPRKRSTTRKRLTSTGGLKSLPIVTPSIELLSHATNRSKKVSQDMLIKNSRNRARKWAAERMDMLGKAVSVPLRDIMRQYNYQLPILHPFEATLADLTVRAREKSGKRTLQSVLDGVNDFRKAALEISKKAAQEVKQGEKKVEIMRAMDAGYADMEEYFLANGRVVEDLTEVQKSLRSLPIVQLRLPTAVLVGAPNVGKSSIVRAVSTGTPEINSYPFTTRGMSLGHMFHPKTRARYQIMDTPGVLSRPDSDRNEMEALTLASMQHLPTAVVFVMDLSGLSGLQSSLESQMDVRHELRRRFPKRPWLDVVSKADLPRMGLEEAKMAFPDGYVDLSTEDGTGVVELKKRLFEMYEVIETILEPLPEIQA